MYQQHLDDAVARMTGESIQTIRQRGFGLLRLTPQTSHFSKRQSAIPPRPTKASPEYPNRDVQRPAAEF